MLYCRIIQSVNYDFTITIAVYSIKQSVLSIDIVGLSCYYSLFNFGNKQGRIQHNTAEEAKKISGGAKYLSSFLNFEVKNRRKSAKAAKI